MDLKLAFCYNEWASFLKIIRDDRKKNVLNLGTCPKLADPPPPHNTLGTQKFRNILLDEFGNIDFGITHFCNPQGPKLGG